MINNGINTMMSWENTMGNMMGGGGFWSFTFTLTSLVWLIVGILAIVWLLRQLTKK